MGIGYPYCWESVTNNFLLKILATPTRAVALRLSIISPRDSCANIKARIKRTFIIYMVTDILYSVEYKIPRPRLVVSSSDETSLWLHNAQKSALGHFFNFAL